MLKKHIPLYFLVFIFQLGFGQYKQLSLDSEISIITAGPGKILYEGFGHSTIRVKDADFDLAYNYGIFDQTGPSFYVNFTKGKMLYKVMKYPFHYFVRSYNKDKRWIKEQVLNLSQEEKQHFFEYLENNTKPENASYYYDPYFNNCATKLRQITDIVLGDKVDFHEDKQNSNESFRSLMNTEIPWNTWGSFGINLALGNKLDAITTDKQKMYLPDYVYTGFKNATVKRNDVNERLIKKEQAILSFKEQKMDIPFFSPFALFFLIMSIGLFITFKDIKKKKRTKWLDFFLLTSTGILGVLILFLWFFTDHSTTPNNFNFLWAFAPNLYIAFVLTKKGNSIWMKKYFQLLLLMLIVTPIIWILKIQELPFSIISFLVLLFVRYLVLIKVLLPFKK
jgi:hypothetical protein